MDIPPGELVERKILQEIKVQKYYVSLKTYKNTAQGINCTKIF